MARNVFEEWQMFNSLENFRDWLDSGAPSQDAVEATTEKHVDNGVDVHPVSSKL
jgi:hypothetical protein